MNSTELLSMSNLNGSNCFSLHLKKEKKKLEQNSLNYVLVFPVIKRIN